MLRALFLLLFCGQALAFSQTDVERNQPAITESAPPNELLVPGDKIEFHTTNRGFGDYLPQVTSFDGRGKLLASWTPHKNSVKNRPTFIFLHGGHGITGVDIGSAVWAQRTFNANILVLDSYWSRGKKENWYTFNEYGANMRALDAIAAGKFVLSRGVDSNSIYLMGESQGGWAVLRALTNDKFFKQYSTIFAAGIAAYPVCRTGWGNNYPDLGPYTRPLLIFTGGLDTGTPISQCDKDVLTSATLWQHYPDATHGFDIIFKGMLRDNPPDYDGVCTQAMNVYNHFKVCRNNRATEDMHSKIRQLVDRLTPY